MTSPGTAPAQKISLTDLRGTPGEHLLEELRQQHLMEDMDLCGFMDGSGYCLTARELSSKKLPLFFRRMEGQSLRQLFPAELAANMLFHLRYASQTPHPLFRLFEHHHQGTCYTFVTAFLSTELRVRDHAVLAFFTQHISSINTALLLEGHQELFRRNEIARDIQRRRGLSEWAKNELLLMGFSLETPNLICMVGERYRQEHFSPEVLPPEFHKEEEDNEPLEKTPWKMQLARHLLEERGLFCWEQSNKLGVAIPWLRSSLGEETPLVREQKEEALFLQNLCNKLFPSAALCVGVARKPRPFASCHISIPEALRASSGALFGCTEPLIHFQQIGYGSFLHFASPEWQDFVRGMLAPLHSHKENPEELLRTLEALLHFPSTSKAAAFLHIHPNTLAYRKRQLEDIFGENLQDPHLRTNLFLALKAYRFRQENLPATDAPGGTS